MSDTGEPAHVPPTVSLQDLEPWERHLWQIPGLTVEERRAAGLLIRLQRGDLNDDTGALRELHGTLEKILKGEARP